MPANGPPVAPTAEREAAARGELVRAPFRMDSHTVRHIACQAKVRVLVNSTRDEAVSLWVNHASKRPFRWRIYEKKGGEEAEDMQV